MGLGSEFLLPIAHSIYQQILEHQRILHTDKRTHYAHSMMYGTDEMEDVPSTNVRLCNTPLIVDGPIGGRSTLAASGDKTTQWNPSMQQISDADVAKYEKQEERKARYEKRKK